MQYEVVRNLKHTGTHFKPGALVNLNEKSAEELLRLGVVKQLEKKADTEAGSPDGFPAHEQTSDTEQKPPADTDSVDESETEKDEAFTLEGKYYNKTVSDQGNYYAVDGQAVDAGVYAKAREVFLVAKTAQDQQ